MNSKFYSYWSSFLYIFSLLFMAEQWARELPGKPPDWFQFGKIFLLERKSTAGSPVQNTATGGPNRWFNRGPIRIFIRKVLLRKRDKERRFVRKTRACLLHDFPWEGTKLQCRWRHPKDSVTSNVLKVDMKVYVKCIKYGLVSVPIIYCYTV